jgi:hypothetical protein
MEEVEDRVALVTGAVSVRQEDSDARGSVERGGLESQLLKPRVELLLARQLE